MDRVWGPVNTAMLRVLRQWRAQEISLISISQERPVYREVNKNGVKTSVETSERERAGFSKLGYTCDVSVRTTIEDGEFTATVALCKANVNLIGMPFQGDELNFATIMGTCTDTDPEEWK